jgi:uncharacterized protein YwgA
MKEQTKRFIAYLNLLDERIDSGQFGSRIKAQKLAYILQKLTGNVLYDDFNFYIRGPYSRELAKEYFDFRDDFVEGRSGYVLTNEEREELERTASLLRSLDQEALEILASLLYLKDKRGMDENQAEAKLHELKPHLKQESIWRGMNTLKKLLLTDKLRIALMTSVGKEMEDWDRISSESLRTLE